MTVGERIRYYREKNGWTQDELAKRMGYAGKATICKIEGLGDHIGLSKVERFAEALHVRPSVLMGWEDTETPYDNVNVNSIWNAKGRIVDLHLFGRYVHESTINALNEENQKKVQAYAEKLLELQKMEEDN